jgi:aspartyl-tRNA(Asn)/glutamyl-tRNA(Gln) amidotransferase subunit B
VRLIDFNRCGVPLVEMVTNPDLRSSDEAAQYLTQLRQLLRWLGVSEADMEKGHLRCDANVSIRPVGATYLNPKTEIKNVNSIDAVRTAIEKELERQIEETKAGRRIESWTLEWDEDSGKLKKMRSKETEADYRYFREPDLLAVAMDEEWKKQILTALPEMPFERRQRFIKQYGLPEYDADILTAERKLSDYFEAAVQSYGGDPKKVSNWLMNDILRLLNDKGISADQLQLTPAYLGGLLRMLDAGTINAATAKSLLVRVAESGQEPAAIVEKEGLAKVSNKDAIRQICEEVVRENPNEVASYKGGKVTLMGWFVGQVMRKMRGKSDPNITKELLEELLK